MISTQLKNDRFSGNIPKQTIKVPKGKITKTEEGINFVSNIPLLDSVVPDDMYIWGIQKVPDITDIGLDMVSEGHKSITREKMNKHNELAIRRAKILTLAKKHGWKIPAHTSSMGFGGGKIPFPSAPEVIPDTYIPILIPPSEAHSLEVSGWTDAQIFDFVSNGGPGGYVDYIGQGGNPVLRLDVAYNNYMEHIVNNQEDAYNKYIGSSGDSKPSDNTPETKQPEAPIETKQPEAPIETKQPDIPDDKKILKNIGMPAHWKRIVRATWTGIDYKTTGKKWLAKYFKEKGRPATKEGVLKMVEAFKNDNNIETKTPEIEGKDVEKPSDNRATDDPSQTNPGLVKTEKPIGFGSEPSGYDPTKTEKPLDPTKPTTKTGSPDRPPFPPTPPGITEKPITPEKDPKEEKKKKDKPYPPLPRLPDRRPPIEPDGKDENPEESKVPVDIEQNQSSNTGYLRPYFLVGGQDILALTRREEIQEIKDWDLFDLPIPENESYDNPLYLQRKRIENLRFGYVYQYPQVRQTLLVERPKITHWTNQSMRRSSSMARPMISQHQNTAMRDPFENPTNRTVVNRDRHAESELKDYTDRYGLIHPDLVPLINNSSDSVKYAKPRISYTDAMLAMRG